MGYPSALGTQLYRSRRMAKRYKVKLTEQERSDLLVLTRKGKASVRRVKRALVLLRSDEGATDEQIVAGVGVGVATVERIRKRFVEEGLEAALSEKPRPPMPPKLSGKAEALLLALACRDVPDGRARWSLRQAPGRRGGGGGPAPGAGLQRRARWARPLEHADARGPAGGVGGGGVDLG